MSDCCNKPMDTSLMHDQQRKVLRIVLAINVLTFCMMLAAAMVSGSSSLLSGSLDNFGDALTYALSLAVVGATHRAQAKVAMVKGSLIFAAAIAVALQILWRLNHPGVPLFESMGLAAVLNLVANLICLKLLTPYRFGNVNLASAWECSRNDVYEGFAVIAATIGVWLFKSGWPDLLIASLLLILFLRSAWRVFRNAWAGLKIKESTCN